MPQAQELHRLGLFVGLASAARFTADQLEAFRADVRAGWCPAEAYRRTKAAPGPH